MIKVALQSGFLSFGARPKLEVFEELQHQFTTVVCLQTHREDLEMLERKVRQTSLQWVHIPLMCASRFLLRDLPSFEAFRASIQLTVELLAVAVKSSCTVWDGCTGLESSSKLC
jgi:hypothetical protein